MSLTTCPDCSHQVSTLAKACPGCGRPTNIEIEKLPADGQASQNTAYNPKSLNKQESLLTKNLGADGFIFGLMIIAGLFVVPGGWGWLILISGAILFAIKLAK